MAALRCHNLKETYTSDLGKGERQLFPHSSVPAGVDAARGEEGERGRGGKEGETWCNEVETKVAVVLRGCGGCEDKGDSL